MSRPSYTERVAALALGVLAVASPLYIDRRPSSDRRVDGRGGGCPGCWPPLFLIVLIVAISLTRFLDRRCTSFDPYWIHRAGGSSCGLVFLLLVLALVLRCKAGSVAMN